MRVLVTGAEGMVGKVLVDKLVENNIDVVASVYPGKTGIFKDIQSEFFKKVEADITGVFWDDLLKDVTHVVHLAAMVHVHEREKQIWEDFYKVNVTATQNLCRAAKRTGIKKFFFVSTVGVHGDFPLEDANGNLIIRPNSFYAESKLKAEEVVIKELSGIIPFVIFRPVMLYGLGDRGNMGRMIEAIRKGRFVIPGSGKNKKSAMYVKDFVEIIWKSLNNERVNNSIFIVSNKNVITLREMCYEIALQLGKRKVFSVPDKFLRVAARIGDIIPNFPLDTKTLNKLTKDSDFSRYSSIQDVLGIDKETSFAEAMSEILKRE